MLLKLRQLFVDHMQNKIALLLLTEPRPLFFVISALLSALVTVLSFSSIGLLFPLVHGVITGSFDFFAQIPAVWSIISLMPIALQTSAGMFFVLVCLLYVLVIVKNIVQYYTNVYAQTYAYQATISLRNRLFRVCVSLDKHFYDSNKTSSIHHTFMKLPVVLESQFYMVQRYMTQCVLIVMYVSIMLFISWQLTTIVLLVFPLLWLGTYRIVSRIQASAHAADAWSIEMSNRLLQRLLCMPIIQGFAKNEYEATLFEQLNAQELSEMQAAKKLSNLITPIEEISITTVALCVAGGMAFLIQVQMIPQASLLFMFFYLAYQVLRSVSVFNTMRIHGAHAEPVTEYVVALLAAETNHVVVQGTQCLPAIISGIEIKHLSFTYPDGNAPVLCDVSFTIPKGKVIALVGVNGSGKSTLTNLLLRLYDCPQNTIFIDGVDIRTFTIDSILRRCSFVYQDALLFNLSVKENVLYGANDEDADNEITKTLSELRLHDAIESITGGLGGVIGDRASNISGGQKKIVALARALLREHEFLILDEATNALDPTTEREVLTALLEDVRVRGKTVLLISHRLSTVRYADEIVFLEKGSIVEAGTYDALIQKQGSFFKHWHAHHPHAAIPARKSAA
jgi:ABC-type multidrug transport system fused ATPase/permease subunit